jgi:hypothetical protein
VAELDPGASGVVGYRDFARALQQLVVTERAERVSESWRHGELGGGGYGRPASPRKLEARHRAISDSPVRTNIDSV